MPEQIEIVWTRSDFERVVGRSFTNKEWEVIASEVQGDVEEIHIPETIASKFSIIDHLVSQDEKFD
jgi:hypothetical protein